MELDKGTQAIIKLAIVEDRDENNKYISALINSAKEEIITRTNENCTNQIKIIIGEIQNKDCQGLENHKKEHEVKEKRFSRMITIIPAVITSAVLLINWGKEILIKLTKG